jgi:ABC-type polysaccharide/polyol phosphate export permease
MILIYTLVFSKTMRAKLGGDNVPISYSLYPCVGLILWILFAEVINRGAVTLMDNAVFLEKLSVPPFM